MKKIILLVVTSIMLSFCVNAQEFKAAWEALKQHETPEWFRDAKFGIYFHWGVYSYMGKTEWYSHHMYEDKDKGWNHWLREYHIETYGDSTQYYDFFPKFTAAHFDADDWAKLFKDAGAQFAGPVAEHCDGFSNWDSKVNKFNTVNYGPKRDLVGELAKAIKKQDLKFVTTFHHSWEWGWYMLWNGYADTTNTEYRELFGELTPKETFYRLGKDASGQSNGLVLPEDAPSRKFVDMWKSKIFEVVDNYEPDLLWFDSRLFVLPEEDRKEVVEHYYNKGKEWKKDVVLTYKNNDLPEGVAVLDLETGRMDEKTDFPWLTDNTFSENGWCWANDMKVRAVDKVIDELIDITSKNGCLLLNITPTHDGLIPAEMRQGLLEIGEWLQQNGEAIYGTRPFVTYGEGLTILKKNHFGGVDAKGIQYQPGDFRFTIKGDFLYVIQLGTPNAGQKFVLKTFGKTGAASGSKISNVEVLGSSEKVKWSLTDEGLSLIALQKAPNSKAIVYKVKLIK